MRWEPQTVTCGTLSWHQVTERLATLVRCRKESDARIVAVLMDDGLRYVQFRATDPPGGVRCETVSNRLLTGSFRLSKATTKALLALGWNAPRRQDRHFWHEHPAGTPPLAPARFAIRTMREAFGAPAPASVRLWAGVHSIRGVQPYPFDSEMQVPSLPKGQILVNLGTDSAYRITRPLGEGGFGAVYRVVQTRPSRKFPGKLCVKIASCPEAWHREAYFGQILSGTSRAIAVFDSFAVVEDWPFWGRRPLYCLVTELAEHGDLVSYLDCQARTWSEAKIRREVREILHVLVRLHQAGAVHRDLTLSNVLVSKGHHLKLGDFGIARHRSRGPVPADMFNPVFAPPSIVGGATATWRPQDDVYQIGMILAALVAGTDDITSDSDVIKELECSPALKAVIQRAVGQRRNRYRDAAAMLAALAGQEEQVPAVHSLPGSLAGLTVVFTGTLSISRPEATRLAKRGGASVQPKITARTDILVEGVPSERWKADRKGQKLLDVDRERERGHHIAVISERELLTMAEGHDQAGS